MKVLVLFFTITLSISCKGKLTSVVSNTQGVEESDTTPKITKKTKTTINETEVENNNNEIDNTTKNPPDSEKPRKLSEILGTKFSLTKNSMLGEIFNITLDTDKKEITGQVDFDGDFEDEKPYILKSAKTIQDKEENAKLWSQLIASLDEIQYGDPGEEKCRERAMIADLPTYSAKNETSRKVYSDSISLRPLLCRIFDDKITYLEAIAGALFIKAGPEYEPDQNRMCTMDVTKMSHRVYKNLKVTAFNGCQRHDLSKWGYVSDVEIIK